MKINTILFDLDGTLLPMDLEVFTKAYFAELSKKLAPNGYKPEEFIENLWKGIYAMYKNDGSKTNEAAFEGVFSAIYGKEKYAKDKTIFDDFYKHDFDNIMLSCGFTKKAKETVDFLKAKGYRVAIATNPIFPATATEKRILWAGLSPSDFELYTTYENSHFCKPNPSYYTEVLEKLGCKAEECLMVGNDITEDGASMSVGIKTFFISEYLINKENKDISSLPHGDFEDLISFLE